jgi:hypothetical protein
VTCGCVTKYFGGQVKYHLANTHSALRSSKKTNRTRFVMDGKNGGGHKNKKDMADHKFWATQPVRRLDERKSFFPTCG